MYSGDTNALPSIVIMNIAAWSIYTDSVFICSWRHARMKCHWKGCSLFTWTSRDPIHLNHCSLSLIHNSHTYSLWYDDYWAPQHYTVRSIDRPHEGKCYHSDCELWLPQKLLLKWCRLQRTPPTVNTLLPSLFTLHWLPRIIDSEEFVYISE